jgi:hypothetical protein
VTDAPDLTHLLSPTDVGPVTPCSRVVSTSHQTGLVHDYLPTDDLIADHGAPRGGFLPEIIGYERLREIVHDQGAQLLVQSPGVTRSRVRPGSRHRPVGGPEPALKD